MSDIVERAGRIRDAVYEEAGRMDKLARALYRTGNHDLADELMDAGDNLRQQSKNVFNLVGDMIRGDLRQAQEGAANTLKACPAGVELAQRDADESRRPTRCSR